MGLEFFKKKKEEAEMKKVQAKLQHAKDSLAKFKSTTIKLNKQRVMKEDDDLIVDEEDSGSEEYEESEEPKDEIIETEEVDTPELEPKETNVKIIVVKEIPMQPVLFYKDKKTGQNIRFMTIEEALTKILERLEE